MAKGKKKEDEVLEDEILEDETLDDDDDNDTNNQNGGMPAWAKKLEEKVNKLSEQMKQEPPNHPVTVPVPPAPVDEPPTDEPPTDEPPAEKKKTSFLNWLF